MLDNDEVNKLFDLLRELHGKDKPRDDMTVAIWAQMLKYWDYNQVRAAALKRARANRYYPDPAELTCLLPPPAAKEEPVEDRPKVGKAPWENEYYTPQVVARMKKDIGEIDAFLAEHGEEFS